MSRFTLIAVIALGLLLVGATAVFAQNGMPGYGRSMMQAPATTTPSTPAPVEPGTTTPGPGMMGNGQYGPGMMGNGDGQTGPGMMGNGQAGPGMMGASGMSTEEMQAAHEAMQNGDWEGMRNTCQQAWERNQGSGTAQPTEPSSTTRTRGGGRIST